MENKVEDIPKAMEKFFGCSGKIVKPSTEIGKSQKEAVVLGYETNLYNFL